jgi:hypothetical protein
MVGIVNVNTNEIVARMAPHKDRKSGFTFQPGHYYHGIIVANDSGDEKLTKLKIYEKYKYQCEQKGDKCFLDTYPVHKINL